MERIDSRCERVDRESRGEAVEVATGGMRGAWIRMVVVGEELGRFCR